MKRDLNRLADQHFDVLIIGGGIQGAAIALESARAGFDTALFEQKDFSHATSANSLKILHGGFRYLQKFNIKRMRASIKSQIEFKQIAPHLVVPLGCVIPTRGFGLRGRKSMRIALLINDLINWDRIAGQVNGHRLERGRILSKKEFLKILPSMSDSGFNGAALWHDALAMDTERLTLALVNEAYDLGACVANYVKAVQPMIQRNRIFGVVAEDTEGHKQFGVRARTVINAAGPWVDRPFAALQNRNEGRSYWARGMNIVVNKKLVHDFAVGLEGSAAGIQYKVKSSRNKRFFFFIPWRGYTMIGTTYKRYDGDPEDSQVQREDIEEFVEEINAIYPSAHLAYDDVTFFHAGILPASKPDSANPDVVQLDNRYAVRNHGKKEGIKGLVSVRSVKYTTAPYIAHKVLKKVKISGRKQERAEAAKGKPGQMFSSAWASEWSDQKTNGSLSPDLVAHLESKYGKYSPKISRYITEDLRSDPWISRKPSLIKAEVLYAMKEEMALHLSDVVLRRCAFGNAECPSRSKLEAVADIMGKELKWSSKQKAGEIGDVLKCYHPLSLSPEKP
jgi:glycerol-3-phosphate dehydrogenase